MSDWIKDGSRLDGFFVWTEVSVCSVAGVRGMRVLWIVDSFVFCFFLFFLVRFPHASVLEFVRHVGALWFLKSWMDFSFSFFQLSKEIRAIDLRLDKRECRRKGVELSTTTLSLDVV